MFWLVGRQTRPNETSSRNPFLHEVIIVADAILVVNAGSSSLKFSIYLAHNQELQENVRGQLESLSNRPRFVARDSFGNTLEDTVWPEGTNIGHEGAIEYLFAWCQKEEMARNRLVGVGHRVVHGGLLYTHPVLVNDGVIQQLEQLIPLAPLHQPHNLAAIKALARTSPQCPQVACFDTAFHRIQPAIAQIFALPRRYSEEGVIRYGFHGLSYEYVASVLPQWDAGASSGLVVVAHLGNGASMCAMKAGRSVATTMSFTPLDGLPMGTRCGALDPGVLFYLMDHYDMDRQALEKMLTKESGFLGVSGLASDMRTLLASDDPRARQAIDLFVYRINRELGSLAAALGGLDVLVFTGGIGENAAAIRARVSREALWLGLELDDEANEGGKPCISRPNSRVSAWVIPTNEELMIARHTKKILETHLH